MHKYALTNECTVLNQQESETSYISSFSSSSLEKSLFISYSVILIFFFFGQKACYKANFQALLPVLYSNLLQINSMAFD